MVKIKKRYKLIPIKELRRKLKANWIALENLEREKKVQLEFDTQRNIWMVEEKEQESMLMQRQQLKEE